MKKLAIVGYGNLGRACEKIARESGEFELVGIFSRRRGLDSPFGARFYAQEELLDARSDIDVAALCTGSANDLEGLAASLAGKLNTVDSFDTHARMSAHVQRMDSAARAGGTLSLVGIGWDPGIFSLCRALFEGVLPNGSTHTFWGRGVSQGHSEAIRRLSGVVDAVQYTIPKQEAVDLARAGKGDGLCERDMHSRLCYVVAEEGADRARIERDIKNMPNYFAPYDVEVRFVDLNTLRREHGAMPHAGRVMRSGRSNGSFCACEASLKLDSNPDFTASVLMRYAAACVELNRAGVCGAKTILDVPVSALFKQGEALKFV